MGRVLGVLCCLAGVLFGFLAALVLLFQLACAMARVPRPGFLRAAAVILVTSVVWFPVEGVLAWVVHAVYEQLNYPVWEAGLVTFFLGLPVDLVISSAVHAGMLRLRFGKAVEVWFAHRLILLTLVMAFGGLFAVLALLSPR